MADFMAGAVKHPGVVKARAAAEGMTVHAWAVKHRNDPGVWGKRARLALVFEQEARNKSRG